MTAVSCAPLHLVQFYHKRVYDAINHSIRKIFLMHTAGHLGWAIKYEWWRLVCNRNLQSTIARVAGKGAPQQTRFLELAFFGGEQKPSLHKCRGIQHDVNINDWRLHCKIFVFSSLWIEEWLYCVLFQLCTVQHILCFKGLYYLWSLLNSCMAS